MEEDFKRSPLWTRNVSEVVQMDNCEQRFYYCYTIFLRISKCVTIYYLMLLNIVNSNNKNLDDHTFSAKYVIVFLHNLGLLYCNMHS